MQFGLESTVGGKHRSVKLGCSVQSDLGRENLNVVYWEVGQLGEGRGLLKDLLSRVN